MSDRNLGLDGSSRHNKPNALQKMNPMMWRQSRTVKKAVVQVDEFVEKMTKDAPYYAKTPPNPTMAIWQRSEIHTSKLLGEGAFSDVYEITSFQANAHLELTAEEKSKRTQMQNHADEQRLKPFALKLPKRDMLRKPDDFSKAIADLIVESSYLSRLDHPNIIALKGMPVGGTDAFDSGRFDSYFLILDRLTDSLDQRIKKWQKEGPPDPALIPRKTNYALQICNALSYLHQRRIIYRDLKLENVGFISEHHIQLFDFGLVRELPKDFSYDDEQYTMSGAGSQWYMAPELFLTGKYNLKADVYSWAITTYEMLTETKAFSKMHRLEHVAMVCVQGKRPKLSVHKFPKKVENLLRAAWGQSVSQRPNSMQVVSYLERMLPDMGDEGACVWPTVEPDASGAFTTTTKPSSKFAESSDDDKSEASIDAFDSTLDAEIAHEIKKTREGTRESPRAPTYGDVEDQDYSEYDYSVSSMMFSDH